MSAPDPTGPGSPTDEPGYADALAELEAILAGLERDDADVDLLASRVRRAAELIRICRARIADARLEVEQIVVGLDDDAS
ncbi:MAG: exodeoxyribonuclease VII small subunit [Acidimicrobiales bacterium]|nr:exodeoxyribonuclease VII small subunit [Acidimicrobiales bacterium]